MHMQLVLKQIAKETVTGFSYPFAKALLKQLKQILADKNAFAYKQDWPETDGENRKKFILSSDTLPVVYYLSDQVKFRDLDISDLEYLLENRDVSLGTLRSLVTTTENFLAIFEKKSP